MAQAFEPGRRYPERVVNEILKPLFDDYCALRRYLVDEDFLSRTPAASLAAAAPLASRLLASFWQARIGQLRARSQPRP